MNIKEIADRKGRQFKWDESGGHGWFVQFSKNYLKTGWKETLHDIKNLELRDDDVIICTYPKAGTHWIWEIVSMVTKQKPEYEKYSKVALTLENESAEFLGSFSSPRVLNTHVYANCLPAEVTKKKVKVIHVMRSPKDIAVSFFHNMKALNCMFEEPPYEAFSEFLPYVTGEYGVYLIGSMFRYYNELEKFTSDYEQNVLNLYFEQMKLNPTLAVRRVAEFLNKELPESVIEEIAEKCSFQNLQDADKTLKELPKEFFTNFGKEEMKMFEKIGPVSVFRKGEVGDWKNYFTVAENEQFETLLEMELRHNKLWQFYSKYHQE